MERRRAFRSAALALLLILLAGFPGRQSAHAVNASLRQTPRFQNYVHNVGDLFGMGTYIADRYPGLASPALYRFGLTGADWVREDFPADHLHSSSNAPYHFGPYDGVVNQEVGDGFRILGLLDYNNSWTNRDHAWMGHRQIVWLTNQFVHYVYQVVSHYRYEIFYWQVWNEPDIAQHWEPAPNAADYAYLLRRTYWTIKAANPFARVVIAGPSGSDPQSIQYLQQVIRDGGRMDIFAIQPYTWIPGMGLRNEVPWLFKFHKPVWFTEIGWSGQWRCYYCGEPWIEAEKLATVYLIGAISGVQRIFWYDFRDDGMTTNYSDHFGLVEYNLAAKPTFHAFQVGVHFLNWSTLRGTAQMNTLLNLYRFTNYRRTFYVVWNALGADQHLDVRWPYPGVRALNIVGRTIGWSRHWRLNIVVPADSVLYLSPSNLLPRIQRSLPVAVRPGHTR